MAKNVFRPYEFKNKLNELVLIKPPFSTSDSSVDEEIELAEEPLGPTVEELRREAEAFKERWETERAMMIQEVGVQSQAILKQAEETAFEIVRKEKESAAEIQLEAEKQAQLIKEQAEQQVAQIEKDALERAQEAQEQATEKGYQEGYEKGYETSKAEVERLTERLHLMIEKLLYKRSQIIESTETQIIQLVLAIAKKVVKVISENQKDVVVNNVLQALRELKVKGEVTIRVNLADLKITSERVKDFLRMIESVKQVTVVEDSTIAIGGCVIETDFGEIDAKISSQLHEIEEKIIEMTPIKTAVQTAPSAGES